MTDVKAQSAQRAAQLLRGQRVLALGTLHEHSPSVTMAPFALLTDPLALVLLVSGLASHTRDMIAEPSVGVLVAEAERDGLPVHALARVSMQANARRVAEGEPGYDAARAAYAQRFADMEMLFTLGDFGLFVLEPTAIRVVAGFAQAASITPAALSVALA